ncbi:thiamine diphosphokinase [Virgibacillus soli]|uniref:Thiamine diphosphokinase n=1 Tax=Paracerasibacillus soli TaxID=480284 RepID=A0ABU5CQP2_9BACI|nr:thiamine diphosphokinase [Virgibacillus soli]MDY0408134.1 thiamine diphosphokinase [Virgibacillus soli]
MNIGIIANGPRDAIPSLSRFGFIDVWIGVDRGTLILLENKIKVDIAIGDFDSVAKKEMDFIKDNTNQFELFPVEKDETDLELAVAKAMTFRPNALYIFGATGGRFDHTLVNMQLLLPIAKEHIKAVIVDTHNYIEMTLPGTYTIEEDMNYENISFIPISKHVLGLTLTGFYYPLIDKKIEMGTTLTISNKLIRKYGTFSYTEGILLLVKSCD